MKKIELLWWMIRYAFHAVVILRCWPNMGWDMALNAGELAEDGYSPREALIEELSCWGD